MTDAADLANLRDIVLPPQIAYWPPAVGWWIVAAGLLVIALIGLIRAAVTYRANAYRRAALRELAEIGFAQNAEQAERISTVLKRAALVAYPRTAVASLTGSGWLGFLDRTGNTDAFTQGAGRDLPRLAFGAVPQGDGEAILRAAELWVRRHQGDGPC